MSKIATPAAGEDGKTSDSPASIGEEDGEPNLDKVNAKLAGLSTEERVSRTEGLENPFDDDSDDSDEEIDLSEYTEEEIGCQNKSVRILPGVARLIASLPKDRYAVATSGAKTCAPHCLFGARDNS